MSSVPDRDREELIRASGRVPPQSLEAEQAVLGCILLDNAACFTASEHLKQDDFYRAPHQVLFQAMIDLGTTNQPVDVLTLTEYLRKKDLLEQAGGTAYLAGLSDVVPSTANLVHYAKIVREKSVLRRLIHTAAEIIARGHEPGGDVDLFLDEAERTIFEIGQDRAKQGFVPVKDVLKRSFKMIEQLYEKRGAVTGVPTGFSELDKMTSGLQPGDLVIVAGRPSMGKTAFALNMAENAAMHPEFHTPVAVFSLEMGTDQLVMRMLTSQGRVDASKLRSGYAGQGELDRLVKAADKLSRAPIFIDDTPAISILEMRAKARRLQSEHGIGMIIIDYLQLMRGRPQSGQESREREISEISRGLKSLAKELKVPVIALSQLNRSLESRTDKRPMLSDLRECVTGETLVCLADGRRVSIASLVGTCPEVLAMSPAGKILAAKSDKVWKVGTREVFEVKVASGRVIRATARHRLYGASGWKRVGDLAPGDRLAIARQIEGVESNTNVDTVPIEVFERVKAAMGAQKISTRRMAAMRGTSYGGSLHMSFSPSRAVVGSYARLLGDVTLLAASESDLFWDVVVSIESKGPEEVFDLTVPGPSSWLADGIVSHNSGAIEQDADVIMFVYRDEYYHKDSEKQGIAEIIIGKQRNGPTGTAEVRFFREFTKFENLEGAGGEGGGGF